MKEFTLATFATHLLELEVKELIALQVGLEVAATHLEKDAKARIGEYQADAGPFQAWPDLAESTQADRLRKGYDPDEPLLRTGELRDSITHEAHALEAVVGSDADILAYQELGTAKIPPRPVLGLAAFKNKEKIKEIIGAASVAGLLGGSLLHPSLGYDFETKG